MALLGRRRRRAERGSSPTTAIAIAIASIVGGGGRTPLLLLLLLEPELSLNAEMCRVGMGDIQHIVLSSLSLEGMSICLCLCVEFEWRGGNEGEVSGRELKTIACVG